MSGKNSIQVAIKVRPLLKKDKDQQVFWRVVDNSIQLLDSQSEPYYFDHIFDQDANNEIIFDKMAKQIVHSAIQGFNGTIFAYGQTSSGKTYTMMGDDENPGVMVLAAKEIFKEIERTQDRQFLLRVGYIEIYNEKICDLLNKKNQDLKIHETSTGIVSVNCEEIIIRSEDDLLYHLDKGGKERTVGETNMNERSSRSHAIFRIIIESRKMDRSEDDAVIQSVINLVDLAGSERADQTGARGTRLKEGGHINKSLLFLSNVIKRLSENEDDKFISFRDSKLTRILQASLGGNALTAIICTIKPNAIEETQSTLSFALRAKAIKNKPQVNEIVSDATMMKRLEHEIKVLKTRLEEEQRKNESQIKVRQLEQRIKDEDLKIISCNSLHSTRNREKRRRTWCPSSTNLDASAIGQPSTLPVPSLSSQSGIPHPSRLQAPKASIYNTPLITMRQTSDAPSVVTKSVSGLPIPPDDLPEIGEEFAPAEMVNFEMLSPLQTPRNKEMQRKISITPKLFGCAKSTLEKVEKDFQELQSFTNLENKVDVQHEPVLTLKYKVETLSQRNAELENERLQFLRLKTELELKTECLTETENKLKMLAEVTNKCSEQLNELAKLTNLNKVANEKIAKYEAELAELKKTNEKLEMENREAVNLEFEFKRHKNKSKLRENELLEALNEKDKEISKLEKSVNSLSAERLQNTKQELLQRSLNEDGKVDADGNVCINSEDLQRLLEENKKITVEFEKLTLEYESLKLNYDEIEKENDTNKLKIVKLEEEQEKEKDECERLLSEVQNLKEQLQNVQKSYELLQCENSSKQEECLALTRQIEISRQEMVVLEEKFAKLESSWQEQQQTISDIEAQYSTIQRKYEQLQSQYEQVEATRGQSLNDYQRLEKENFDLQAEIEDLKKKVHNAQQRLLESNIKFEEAAKETKSANDKNSTKAIKIQHENEQLKIQLQELQTQFEDLQKEYDDLSNQLMDNLQEFESLKKENIKLNEKLTDFENKNDDVAKAEPEISDLKTQLRKVLSNENNNLSNTPSPNRNLSMRSSGVCVEEEEEHFVGSPESEELLRNFSALSESLTEIELEYTKGKTKLFRSETKNSTPNSYKMYLKNILSIQKTQQNFDMEIENIHLQGYFKHHSFHIVELSGMVCNNTDLHGCENITEYIEKLKQEITELKTVNEQERLSNKSLLESTERAFSEMREQITQLSAELLEKSMFVENCSCKTYQQQIEHLQRERADITLVCEELQEKMNTTLNASLQMNSTAHGFDLKFLADDKLKELEKLKEREQELLESYEQMTQRCIDIETELDIAREQLKNQEKDFKENYNQLKLENIQKLELSANEYRDNMKKYNKEWEDKKEKYEQIIKNLQSQIDELKQEALKEQEFQVEIKQEHVSNNNETEAENQNLENEGTTAEQELQDVLTQEDIEILKKEKLKLQEENLNLKQQLRAAEEQVEYLKEENRIRCEETILMDSKLVHLEELLVDAKALHVTLSRENSTLKTEIDDIREDLDCIPVLHDKNQQLSDEMEKLNLEYSQLKEKLEKPELNKFSKEDTTCEGLTPSKSNQKKKKLKNEIDILYQENKDLIDKLKIAESQLEQYQKVGGRREDRTEVLQTNIGNLASLEKEKDSLTNDLQNLMEEYNQINAKLLKTEQQLELLQKEDTNREELLKSLQTKLDYLMPLEVEKMSLENDCKNFQQECKEMHEKLLSTEKELQKQNVFCEELKKSLQKKLERLTSLEEVNKTLEIDYENLQQEHKQVNAQLLKTKHQLDVLQKEDTNREELLKTLQAKLDQFVASEEEKHRLASDYENLQREHKEVQQKLMNAEQQKEELQKENAISEEFKNTLKIKQDQLMSLEEMNKKLAKDYENLEQEHNQVQDKLQKTEQQIQELCCEDSNREDIIQSLQSELSKLKNIEDEKKNLDSELFQLKALQNSLQEKDAETTKEVEQLKQQFEMLLEKQDQIQSSESKLQLENTELDDKLRQLTNEYNLIKVDKVLLETQLKELEEEQKSLHEKCIRSQEENTTLKGQLTSLKEKEKDEELLEQIIKEKAELVQSLSLLTEKLETAQSQLEEHEKCIMHSKEEKQQIQQDLQTLKKSLTQAIQEKNEQLEEITGEKENIQQDRTNIYKDLQLLKEKFKKVVEEKVEQYKKQEENQKEIKKLQQEKLKQQLLLDQLQQNRDGLEKDLENANELLSKYKKENQHILADLKNISQNTQKENQELKQQLKELNEELITSKHEQQRSLEENAQLQLDIKASKDSLTKLQEEQQNTQEKLIHYQKLQEDKNKLETTLNVLKKAQTGALTSLQDEKYQLLKTLQQYEGENKEFKDKEETLKQKIESLSQQLHEMRIKANSYEQLLLEHEEVENTLTSMTTANQKLQQEIIQLNSQQQIYVSKIENLSSEVDKLKSHLQNQNDEKHILEKKLIHLKETLEVEKCSLQKENQEIKNSLEELQIKCDSLQNTNTQLETLKQQLQQQLNAAEEKLTKSNAFQDELSKLEIQHSQLKHSIKETVEEKIRQITIRNFEYDLQRQAGEVSTANTSSESNTSYSPKARKSLERLGIDKLANISLEEKLNAIQQKNSTEKDRKNRRLSMHDERRRQSYWGAVHDKETMTDPVDTSCNCLDLDRKLKVCERNLFIKNSQVTALSMELKNHPLKEENASLRKRLQEEQDKYHMELKRCKNKLYEQTVKTDKALAAAAHATAKSTHATLLSEKDNPALPKVVADGETQTDDDISACLNKLQGKYNDLKNICRHRYNLIKELEEKVSQKENSDGNSLNKQCESLKRELMTVKEKYEMAKKVLLLRREEIGKLRAQLDTN